MIWKLGIPLVLLATTAVGAANRKPPAGSYGFNWLAPETPCKKLTEKDLATFKSCTVSENAFGLELKSHACKVNARVEYIVYKNATQCQEAYETMQANAP